MIKILKRLAQFTIALVYVMGLAGLLGFFVEKRIWKGNPWYYMLIPIIWPYVLFIAVFTEVIGGDFQWFNVKWYS